jgi:hypothetical protein
MSGSSYVYANDITRTDDQNTTADDFWSAFEQKILKMEEPLSSKQF